MNFEFLKITAPTIFHQRFEPGTLGSESLYVDSSMCARVPAAATKKDIGQAPAQKVPQ